MSETARPVVLCVDDDLPVLSAIRRLLRHEPFELLWTSDPAEALARVGERRVDLVIADQRMPAMSGTELLKAVRSRSPETVRVILTGHADLSDIGAAVGAGTVDRLIRKPWDDAEFRGLVLALATGGREARRPPLPPRPLASPRTSRVVDCARPEDVAAALREAAPSRLLRLERLPELPGSVTRLLQGVIDAGVPTALVDPSGLAAAYLEVVDGVPPVVAVRAIEDLPAPKRALAVEERGPALAGVLRAAGHACDAARTVAEAVERLREGRYDVLVLDLIFPDAGGLELARHLLEQGLRTPIVATSAAAELEGLGVRRLPRPPKTAELLAAVDAVS